MNFINNYFFKQPKKRGRPRKSEVREDWSMLNRGFICHLCSDVCNGFQEAVVHMNEQHRDGDNESPDKVCSIFE